MVAGCMKHHSQKGVNSDKVHLQSSNLRHTPTPTCLSGRQVGEACFNFDILEEMGSSM